MKRHKNTSSIYQKIKANLISRVTTPFKLVCIIWWQ